MPTIQQIAEAFSRHQFTDTYAAHFAADVRWVSVGESILEGRDAVIAACDQSSTDLAQVSTEFVRFRSIVGTDAVDSVGRKIRDFAGKREAPRRWRKPVGSES